MIRVRNKFITNPQIFILSTTAMPISPMCKRLENIPYFDKMSIMHRMFQTAYIAFGSEDKHIFRDKYGGLFHCLTGETRDNHI